MATSMGHLSGALTTGTGHASASTTRTLSGKDDDQPQFGHGAHTRGAEAAEAPGAQKMDTSMGHLSGALKTIKSMGTSSGLQTMKSVKSLAGSISHAMNDKSKNANLSMVLVAARRVVLWSLLFLVASVIYSVAYVGRFSYLNRIGHFFMYGALGGVRRREKRER